jgi:hypothetical protein
MGRIIQQKNGKKTIYTVGEDFNSLSAETNTYYIGVDLGSGEFEKKNPNGDIINLEGAGGGGHYIGELVGGGIVVALWKEGTAEKALIASLTNLSTGIEWTLPAFDSTLIGSGAQSFSDGLTNTNAIIAQTTFPAANTYAAGLARLHSDGGNTDWYLPSNWELNMCYNSAAIVNKVLGSASFIGNAYYWSSTEYDSSNAWFFGFFFGTADNSSFKSYTVYVRAVRTHTF